VSAASRSRRAWGWYQLDDRWAARLVADAAVPPGALVFDLGAGTGALTGHLLDTGARVVAVELHPGRAQRLRDRFAGRRLTVLELDVLDLRIPTGPYRVVANPPWGIASPLVRLLTSRRSGLVAADLLLPRAVVRRHADAGGPGRWRSEHATPVPRHAFRPAPQVDAAVLRLRASGRR